MLLYEQYSRRGIWGAHVSGIWGLSTCESGGLGALSDERGSGPLSLRELGGHLRTEQRLTSVHVKVTMMKA